MPRWTALGAALSRARYTLLQDPLPPSSEALRGAGSRRVLDVLDLTIRGAPSQGPGAAGQADQLPHFSRLAVIPNSSRRNR